MKRILFPFLFLIALSAQSQYFEKVRRAELHFVRNEVQEAAAIYNELFDLDRKALLSQDCLNAAYCELKTTGFLGAQRFLNLLAVRNVPWEVIEEYSGLKDQVDTISWENFRTVYAQLFAGATPQNDYTVFQEEFVKEFKTLMEVIHKRPVLPTYRPTSSGFAIYLGDSIVKEVSGKVREDFQKAGQSIADSVIATQAFKIAQENYMHQSDKLFNLYLDFFKEHEWPKESELKDVYPFSRGGLLLQYVGFWVRVQDPANFVFINRENIIKHYLYTDAQRELILGPILNGISIERIKPSHVFKSIHPDIFEKTQSYQYITLQIEDKTCDLDGKHFLKPINEDIDFAYYQEKFGLEAQDNITEKFVWAHLSEEKFSLNVHFQKEQSTYSTCEQAQQFIAKDKLIEVSPLSQALP